MLKDVTSKIESALNARVKHLAREEKDRDKGLIAKVGESVRSVIIEQRDQQAETVSRVLATSLTAQEKREEAKFELLHSEIQALRKSLKAEQGNIFDIKGVRQAVDGVARMLVKEQDD